MKQILISTLISFLVLTACNLDEILNDAENSDISAKTKLNDVLSTARKDFSSDAQLSAIYGLNVSTKGEIDLSRPGDNAFVYVVQSDSEQANEFYVPVFGSGPVKSPIDFNSMLSLVKDQTAKNILGNVFGGLSTINIDPSVSYDDSPAIIEKMLTRSDVSNFRSSNSGSKIDMFLFRSLVLWLHPGTVNGTVTKISD